MRRSLGQKPGVLPVKRMRQSQENAVQGGLPGVSASSRQSRASNTGMSSSKRVSSVSR